MAGRGHYYFISNMNEIDSKVLDCLQRESYEYLIIKSLTFYNAQGEPLLLSKSQDKHNPMFTE